MVLKIKHSDLRTIFFSVLSGLLLTLSFPKVDLYGLSWIAFVPLFSVMSDLTPKKSFMAGLCFGLAHFLSLLYWIVFVLNTYGYIPFALCLPIVGLLAFYLALYPAFFALFLSRFCKKPVFLMILAPPAWVFLEYIRTFAFTGFPWELLGYSQHNFSHIIQMADTTGVYGVSFLIMLVNCGFFTVFLFITKHPWQGRSVTSNVAIVHSITASILFILAIIYGQFRIQQTNKWVSQAPSLTVSVIQGNIDQALKWTPAYQQKTLLKYNRLSSFAAEDHPDLIVWPETAAPFYYGNDKVLTTLLKQGITTINTEFLIGCPSYVQKQNRFEFYNTAYLLDKEGNIKNAYSKVHLVPFGEYVPLKNFLPFIHKLTEQSGDFYSGRTGETLKTDNATVGVQICFEVIFQNLSRAMVNNNAQLLVTITNDAWFGQSSAPFQHLSMVKFRAIENRRAVARSANTGISGFIDPVGREIASTELYTDAYLTRKLPLLEHLTVYTRYGDWFAILCLPMLAFAWLANDRPRTISGETDPEK